MRTVANEGNIMPLKLSRRAVAVGVVAMGISGLAIAAQPPSTGLGEAWPNAIDVSQSPHYHVYVFVRDGIRYIQVNEGNGTVDAAIATAGDIVLTLPVGREAQHVHVLHLVSPMVPMAATSVGTTETVYHDASMTILATPQSNGTNQITVAATCTDPGRCSG